MLVETRRCACSVVKRAAHGGARRVAEPVGERAIDQQAVHRERERLAIAGGHQQAVHAVR